MIAAGADIENGDGDEGNNTPLIWACVNGSAPIVRQLLAAGARKEACTTSAGADGWTPLHWAASMGHANFVQLLKEAGADTRAQASDGKTAKDLGARHAAVGRVLGPAVRLLDTPAAGQPHAPDAVVEDANR